MQRAGRAEQLAQAGTTVLFCALIATSTCYDGHDFAGASRLVAVGAAGLLAWRRAPFIVVVVAAVLTAALLRLSGIP
jgi:ABC-type transporter Mla maintaining outer membrane lipid asymmetry permease subunit MlaE